jgi:hypothetical protein
MSEEQLVAKSKDPSQTKKDQYIQEEGQSVEEFKEEINQVDDVSKYILERYKQGV